MEYNNSPPFKTVKLSSSRFRKIIRSEKKIFLTKTEENTQKANSTFNTPDRDNSFQPNQSKIPHSAPHSLTNPKHNNSSPTKKYALRNKITNSSHTNPYDNLLTSTNPNLSARRTARVNYQIDSNSSSQADQSKTTENSNDDSFEPLEEDSLDGSLIFNNSSDSDDFVSTNENIITDENITTAPGLKEKKPILQWPKAVNGSTVPWESEDEEEEEELDQEQEVNEDINEIQKGKKRVRFTNTNDNESVPKSSKSPEPNISGPSTPPINENQSNPPPTSPILAKLKPYYHMLSDEFIIWNDNDVKSLQEISGQFNRHLTSMLQYLKSYPDHTLNKFSPIQINKKLDEIFNNSPTESRKQLLSKLQTELNTNGTDNRKVISSNGSVSILLPQSTSSNDKTKQASNLDSTPSYTSSKRKPWTSKEIQALETGIAKFGAQWAKILKHNITQGDKSLNDRSNVNLKDKARNEVISRIKNGQPLGIFENIEMNVISKLPKKM